MVALFPALIVAAAVVALLPETLPLRLQMATFFSRVVPSAVRPLLDVYFVTTTSSPHTHTARVLLGSVVVGTAGAANVMATLMEGFRRAHELPLPEGSFLRRRARSLALVPLSLVPMALASGLVVFGHFLSVLLAGAMPAELQRPVYILAFIIRWTAAVTGSVGIIAVIYHLGTDPSTHVRDEIEPWLREPWLVLRKDWSWRASLPGAAVATLLWFVSTLVFGWYVTRFADYGRVYGSLGAGIALMFWLYIIALSVLVGSEFNAQLRLPERDATALEFLWKLPRLRRRARAEEAACGRMADAIDPPDR
jgi:membrane protein